MTENLVRKLSRRLYMGDVRELCRRIETDAGDEAKEALFGLITHPDSRVGYNVLWVFSHLHAPADGWLRQKRDALADLLLATRHTGQRRLLLSLLERQPASPENLRTDLLDYCLAGILSTEPYAIRALCLKLSYALCRFHPELTDELQTVAEMMDNGQLSPALRATRRHVLTRIARQRKKSAGRD